MSTTPLIVSGEGTLVPKDRPYWTTPEMFSERWRRPNFTKREVAQFFGRSVTWLVHFLSHPDPEIGPITPIRTPGGRMRWKLHDVELIAHTFLRQGRITLEHFAHVINVLKSTATMYGYDVGDLKYQMLWYLDEGPEPSLVEATALVSDRLRGNPPSSTTETERLAETAAWAVERLQEHLKGLKT